METVEKSIVVDVPVRTAYDQWTQFEEFPRFMEGVHEVRQLDDRHLYWRASIGGREVEWEAEITEQVPDRIIAWRSTSGSPNGGQITFEPLGRHTRVRARMSFEPQGTMENLGHALGLVDRRVGRDLDRFKDFIERRGFETGAWRGEIHGGRVERHGGWSGTGRFEPGRSTSDRWGQPRYDEDRTRTRSDEYGGHYGDYRRMRDELERPEGRERYGVDRGYRNEPSRGFGPGGAHVGRGPKGYRRSDERIQDDVCQVLTDHPGVDASDLEVRVKDGLVTLEGTVTDRHEKWLAEDVVEEMPGVKDVDNRIRVTRAAAAAQASMGFGRIERETGRQKLE